MNLGMIKSDYIWRVRKGELLLKIMKLMFNKNKKYSHSLMVEQPRRAGTVIRVRLPL